MEVAKQLGDSGPFALQAAKEALYRGQDMSLTEGLKFKTFFPQKQWLQEILSKDVMLSLKRENRTTKANSFYITE
jgi:enoyl-CoA hydratase/carnithine racemase